MAVLAAACAEIPPPPPAPDTSRALPMPARPLPADAANLVGRGAGEIAELLGEPRLKRRDPPAELWQYRAERCVLDLFFYADADGRALTVAHVETRPRDASPAECLRAIRNAAGGG